MSERPARLMPRRTFLTATAATAGALALRLRGGPELAGTAVAAPPAGSALDADLPPAPLGLAAILPGGASVVIDSGVLRNVTSRSAQLDRLTGVKTEVQLGSAPAVSRGRMSDLVGIPPDVDEFVFVATPHDPPSGGPTSRIALDIWRFFATVLEEQADRYVLLLEAPGELDPKRVSATVRDFSGVDTRLKIGELTGARVITSLDWATASGDAYDLVLLEAIA